MTGNNDFWLRFWGVRGSFPVSGASVARYGGHTSCVEVHCAGRCFVFDGGTGLKPLGDMLKDKQIDILLSHTHIDHILGIPFFAPCADASRRIRLWAGHLKPDYDLAGVIGMIMQPPVFPLTTKSFRAEVEYHDFAAGEELADDWQKDGIRITTLPLAHPDRATGYRLACQDKSVCYITDYEHVSSTPDKALTQFVQGADLLIYDSTYADEEFERYRGWGHSTWQQGVRLADAAGVKKLVVFHHDPDATDSVLDKRAAQLETLRFGSIIAKEGLKIGLIES